MQITELLYSMRRRPNMFIREVRIDYIYHLILGYCGANSKLPEDDINRKFNFWFGKWLIKWIETNVDAKYRPESAYWYDNIIRITPNGQDEVDFFFDLCDEFFEDYENKTGYFSWRAESK